MTFRTEASRHDAADRFCGMLAHALKPGESAVAKTLAELEATEAVLAEAHRDGMELWDLDEASAEGNRRRSR